ncbi:hypothetical protein [Nonlabens antarcticus]|uniref:hypothetical protein n=1 Tax=Nonlabens antarcticus TaxID=392714 RepID=UPI00189194AB|nr:hypothetical protein [Nonlabens antarcticus]
MTEIYTLSRKRTISYLLFAIGILFTLIFISCEEEKPSTTYINGKIVNPKSDYIIISDYANLTDTLKLDEKGRFNISYQTIDSGLFSISYPGEYQSFYLQPGDSLSMRANTKAFDETLSFTGSQARENNYLINLFIDIEDSNMGMLKYKNLAPQVFYDHVQEVKKNRLKKFKKAATKHKFEQRFQDFATFIINLNSYYELERYPVVHSQNIYRDKSIKFPKEFFAHRERVEIDKSKLLNNYAFRPYANALASNIALRNISKTPDLQIDLKGYRYNKERLRVIDSIFDNVDLQNYFAAGEIRNFVRGGKDSKEINLLVTDFLTMSTDATVNEQVAQMAATYINLGPGNQLPNFDLRDANNKKTKLSNRVKRLTVLYYWSVQDKDYALGIHDQVKDLQMKYPEIEFIGINIDNLSFEVWQDAISNNDFRNSKEYLLFDKSAINRQLALRNSNRSMVIDRNLTIIDPNINLFYYKIETTLLGYLNR